MKQEPLTHLAVIMDGNRRWARERNFPALAGHKKVADDILEPLIEHASKKGISYLTFWAWSTENWGRTTEEIGGIMNIFRHIIEQKWQRLHKNGVRIRIIGDITKFPEDIRSSVEKVIDETKHNTKITTIFALNYGGRDEILRAIEKMNIRQKGNLKLDEKIFEQYLDTAGIPDPDMIVRTGGEQRLSGFLLWQSEYAELFFPEWYMPEFTPARLDEVIGEYGKRKRRFGK